MKKKKNFTCTQNVRKVISSIIVVMTISTLSAQEIRKTPKLVVGITIDQLRGDYMEAFYEAFGENGFKRLLREGLVYQNVRFDFSNVDESSAITTIYTGANPDYHGIIGNRWYDNKEKKEVGSVQDPSFIGYSTNDNTSPKKILVSTICDELDEATNGNADIFAFAPNKEAAIISGGHAATAAFWIEDYTGKWASSTYYGDFPWWLTGFADKALLNNRIGSMEWTPKLPIDRYKLVGEKVEEFSHPIGDGQYIHFKNSPFVNTEINSIIRECFKYGAIGKRETTDFFAVTYSAKNYQQMSISEFPMEMMDTYLRLDDEIAELLKMIDENVGLSNAVVFVTSTGATPYLDPVDEKNTKIYGGEFFPDRCSSLLNMFLMATYGKETWVESVYGNQIYLNRKLIDEKKISLDEMQDKAANFLMDFSGIRNVVPAHLLISGPANEDISQMKKGYYHKYIGDLIFEVQPGWVVKGEDVDSYVARKDVFNFPVIYFGGGIPAERIYRPISATEIAPTVSRIMRIRSPNASMSAPSYEIK